MAAGTGVQHTVIPRQTDFSLPDDLTEPTIQEIYHALAIDQRRSEMIASDLLREVGAKRSPLLLTERTEHLQLLAERLRGAVPHVIKLKGGMGRKQRQELMEKLQSIPDTEPRIILATGRYIGEGFDDARLDTLFLTMPISWRGTLQQYVGDCIGYTTIRA
jgi:superfamily II DNA or RNA helicase